MLLILVYEKDTNAIYLFLTNKGKPFSILFA